MFSTQKNVFFSGLAVALVALSLGLLSWLTEFRTPLPEQPQFYGAWSPQALVQVWLGDDSQTREFYRKARSPKSKEWPNKIVTMGLIVNTGLIIFLLSLVARRNPLPK